MHLHRADTADMRPADIISSFPAEAATEVGLDLDHDGSVWLPAPPATLIRPMAVALVLVAGAAGFVFGPELAAWALASWGH